ncbi:hypothetical protein OTU49_016985, partial [Cherax quadricarinatus]
RHKMLQLRRWSELRSLVLVVAVMWFLTAVYVDVETLMVSTSQGEHPVGVHPLPPSDSQHTQESPAWPRKSGEQDTLFIEREDEGDGSNSRGKTERQNNEADRNIVRKDTKRRVRKRGEIVRKKYPNVYIGGLRQEPKSLTNVIPVKKESNKLAAVGLKMSAENEPKFQEMLKISPEDQTLLTEDHEIPIKNSPEKKQITLQENLQTAAQEPNIPLQELKILENPETPKVMEDKSLQVLNKIKVSRDDPKLPADGSKIPLDNPEQGEKELETINISDNSPTTTGQQILIEDKAIKLSHEVDQSEVSLSEVEVAIVKTQIKQINEEQDILNQQIYGPVGPNTTVLLVQVHKRLENLHYLVESMKQVEGINETLVIFSHDLWEPTINAFIRNITSFRVMQIFYPFSLQLHPRTFPGSDPADCAWNASKQIGGSRCTNQPDMYGHYREAQLTQMKHHWWWKIQRVFHGLRATRESAGWVVFLEEDHYLAPDLLHVFHRLLHDKDRLCPHCQVIALGNHDTVDGATQSNIVKTGVWHVTKHNLGYSFNKDTWKLIKACSHLFCTFDDYNWDWTLLRLVQNCCKPRLAMLALSLSRVVHVGNCGTHIQTKSCSVRSEVESKVNYYYAIAQWLFPASFEVSGLEVNFITENKPNGGWGDHRDHQLCQAIVTQILLNSSSS